MPARKIIGTVFSLIAIVCSIIFIKGSDLSFNLREYFDFSLKSYFSLEYFRQITPLIVTLILLYGGVLLMIKPSKSNAVLALFGFTVLEEVVFSWLGIITINLPGLIIAIFLTCALFALWIAYSDKINLKRLSMKDGLSSLFLGTLINLFSYYF